LDLKIWKLKVQTNARVNIFFALAFFIRKEKNMDFTFLLAAFTFRYAVLCLWVIVWVLTGGVNKFILYFMMYPKFKKYLEN